MVGGSRHASSENRSNNWTPIVENQFSSGPYGYQHIFFTGSNTNEYFIHEEPQTQFFYKFKADYFHFSYYLDPSAVLMGKRYRWFKNELTNNDYRVNDMSFIELGFDYGAISLLMQISSEVQIIYKAEDETFYDGQLTIPKFGLEYRNHIFYINFLAGEANENVKSDDLFDVNNTNIGYVITNFNLKFYRVNFSKDINDTWSYKLSYLNRSLEAANTDKIESHILTGLVSYKYSYKYIFNFFPGQ